MKQLQYMINKALLKIISIVVHLRVPFIEMVVNQGFEIEVTSSCNLRPNLKQECYWLGGTSRSGYLAPLTNVFSFFLFSN